MGESKRARRDSAAQGKKFKSKAMYRCRYCHSHEVYRSRHKPFEWFMALLFLRPYRCERCLRRFYGFFFQITEYQKSLIGNRIDQR